MPVSEPRTYRTEPPTRSRGGVRGPKRGLYRVPFFPAHKDIRLTLSAVSRPQPTLPCSSGPLPEQDAWEYPFRKLQAPNSRIVYSPRAAGPTQQHAWYLQTSGPKLPNCALPAWRAPPQETESHEPEPPFQNRNRTEPNRYIHELCSITTTILSKNCRLG